MSVRSRILAAALLLLAGSIAGSAAAQEVTVCPATAAAVDTAERKPDLVIRASARADEVRFRSEPRIDVQLTGCSVLDTVRVIERRNLPEPVQPNVPYRDVFVAIEILGYLDVECLLPSLTSPTGAAAPDAAGVRASLLDRLCALERGDSLRRFRGRR